MVKAYPECINHELIPPLLLKGSDCACQQWQKGASHWDLKNLRVKAKHESNADQAAAPFLPQHLWTNLPFASLTVRQTLLVFLCPSSVFFSSFLLPRQPLVSLDWLPEHQRAFHTWEQKLHVVLLFSAVFFLQTRCFLGEGVGVSLAFSHVSDSALF